MCDATRKSRLSHGKITGIQNMVDLATMLIGGFLVVTVIATFEYHRYIRKAQKEYEKAKEYVEDIVLSFNRELKRESDKVELVAFKVEGNSSKTELGLRKMDLVEKRLAPFEEKIYALNQSYQSMAQTVTQALKDNTQNNSVVLSGLAGLETKIKDIEVVHEDLKIKVASFEEQIQRATITSVQEGKREVVLPPIPIRRDKALAALTETEIAVLEMLSREGAKTAPEIKEYVHLSREHTARLMKRLYEEGYLERIEDKIPFKYSLKKEMEALLQKA